MPQQTDLISNFVKLSIRRGSSLTTLSKSPDHLRTVVDAFKAMVEEMFKGAATAKGALIITPEKVIVTTPGADNKKEI